MRDSSAPPLSSSIRPSPATAQLRPASPAFPLPSADLAPPSQPPEQLRLAMNSSWKNGFPALFKAVLGRFPAPNPSGALGRIVPRVAAVGLIRFARDLGIIEEEKLDSFNVPYYTPSPKEVRREVEKQGSFSIDCLEVFEVNQDVFETDFDPNVVSKEAADKIVGEEIINEVFKRFRAKLGNRLSKEKIPLVNIIISLKKIT